MENIIIIITYQKIKNVLETDLFEYVTWIELQMFESRLRLRSLITAVNRVKMLIFCLKVSNGSSVTRLDYFWKVLAKKFWQKWPKNYTTFLGYLKNKVFQLKLMWLLFWATSWKFRLRFILTSGHTKRVLKINRKSSKGVRKGPMSSSDIFFSDIFKRLIQSLLNADDKERGWQQCA